MQLHTPLCRTTLLLSSFQRSSVCCVSCAHVCVQVAWFDQMKTLTPLYDVTAYLLCRDTVPGSTDSPWYNVSTIAASPNLDSTPPKKVSSSPAAARGDGVDSIDANTRPPESVSLADDATSMQLLPPSCFFAVGERGSDIRDPATYMPNIVEELRQGLALMRTVPPV